MSKTIISIALLCSTFLLFINISFSQKMKKIKGNLANYTKPRSTIDWLEIKDDKKINFNEFIKILRKEIKFSDVDSLQIKKVKSDSVGLKHYFLKQFYQGIEIEDGIYVVHTEDENVISANGNIIDSLQSYSMGSLLNSQNVMTKLDSIIINDNQDLDLSKFTFSDLSLLYTFNNNEFVLSYKCDVACDSLGYNYTFYINALNGSLEKRIDNIIHSVAGSVNTYYNGTRSIQTTVDGSNYILSENDRGPNSNQIIQTLLYPNSFFTDVDNIWNDYSDKQAAASSHWALEMAYDYYLNQHSRKSYDNNGSRLTISMYPERYLPWPYNNCGGCSWEQTDKLIHVRDNCYGEPSASLDIIGHELTHGVDQSEMNLKYKDSNYPESWALKESIADIFGVMVEYYVEGSNGDWLMGEDSNNGEYRSLSNPWQSTISPPGSQPKTYINDQYWYSGSDVETFAYTNMGISNFWFYLLSVGGSGTNGSNKQYVVEGIEKENAIQILYYAIDNGYFISTSDFSDARKATILSARALFGDCSFETMQTANAWYAVGIGYDIIGFDLVVCKTIFLNDYIGVMNKLSAGSCYNLGDPCLIKNGANADFVAGREVVLRPGFHAEMGSNFGAYILPCNITYIPPKIFSSSVDEIHPTMSNSGDTPDMSISPNPTSTQIKLKISGDKSQFTDGNVEILNFIGERLLTITLDEGIYSQGLNLDVSSYPSGMYFCTVRTGSFVETEPFLVIR